MKKTYLDHFKKETKTLNWTKWRLWI